MDELSLRELFSDASEDVVWVATQDELAHLATDTADAALRVSVLHWFDAELIDALRDNDGPGKVVTNGRRSGHELYDELRSLRFATEMRGYGHRFHDLTRHAMVDHLWHHRRAVFLDVSVRAAEYFLDKVDLTEDEMVELVYHLVVAEPDTTIDLVERDVVNMTVGRGHPDLFEALLRAVDEHAAGGRLDREMGLRLRLWKAWLTRARGHVREACRLNEDLLADAEAAGATDVAGRTRLELGINLDHLGRVTEAVLTYERLAEGPSPELAARANLALADIALRRGALDEATERCERALLAALSQQTAPDDFRLLVAAGRDAFQPIAWLSVDGKELGDPAEEDLTQEDESPDEVTEAEATDLPAYLIEIGAAHAPKFVTINVDTSMAESWLTLGVIRYRCQDYDGANDALGLAADIFAILNDGHGLSRAFAVLRSIGLETGQNEPIERSLGIQRQVLQVAREDGDAATELQALLEIGKTHADVGHWAAAVDAYTEVLRRGEEMRDRLPQAWASESLADLEFRRGRRVEADEFMRRAAHLYEELGVSDALARLLVERGRLLLDWGQAGAAEELYQQALERYVVVGNANGQYDAYMGMGRAAAGNSRLHVAATHFRAAATLAAEQRDRLMEVNALSEFGLVKARQRRFSEARTTYDRVLELSRDSGLRASEASALLWLGDALLFEEALDEALSAYSGAEVLMAEIGNVGGQIDSLLGRIAVHSRRQEWNEVLEVARQAWSMAKPRDDPRREARTLEQMALALGELEQFDESLARFREALELDPDQADLIGNYAYALLLAGDYKGCVEWSKRALARDETRTWTLRNIGHAYLAMGRPDEAESAYREAIAARKEDEDFVATVKEIERILRRHPETARGTQLLELVRAEQASLEKRGGSSTE